MIEVVTTLRRRSRSSATTLSKIERHRDWLDLRRQGLPECEIAHRYGVTQQAVSKAILKYLRTLPALAADDLRRLEAERLDALWLAVAPAALRGEPRSVEVAVRISERRCKLLGLDLPVRGVGAAGFQTLDLQAAGGQFRITTRWGHQDASPHVLANRASDRDERDEPKAIESEIEDAGEGRTPRKITGTVM